MAKARAPHGAEAGQQWLELGLGLRPGLGPGLGLKTEAKAEGCLNRPKPKAKGELSAARLLKLCSACVGHDVCLDEPFNPM